MFVEPARTPDCGGGQQSQRDRHRAAAAGDWVVRRMRLMLLPLAHTRPAGHTAEMRRLRFDLNLWLCCTAIAVLIFCVPDCIEYATGHLSFEKLKVFLALGMVGSLL